MLPERALRPNTLQPRALRPSALRPKARPEAPVPLRLAVPEAPNGPDDAAPLMRAGRQVINAASKSVTHQVQAWRARRDLDAYVEDPQWRPAAEYGDEIPASRPRPAAVLLAALALLALGIALAMVMIF